MIETVLYTNDWNCVFFVIIVKFRVLIVVVLLQFLRICIFFSFWGNKNIGFRRFSELGFILVIMPFLNFY